MNCAARLAGQQLRAVLTILVLLASPMLNAKSIAELAALSRDATFEVVLPKVEPAHVTYERPLPLELLSFTERNDRFWSIGTAFAIAPDVFVSNAHVLLSAMGSQMGHPHLRDAQGNTHAVTEVLKFSLHEDFIVFRARGARAGGVLEAAEDSPAIGARVYSVGNALGEGVVVRDGLLTSLTPEDQDGRWKWLRFSAAASPGNSGGPLLDEEGRVLGIVTMRSAGENLNYALPIGQVARAGTASGSIDVRESFRLPILRQQIVTELKASLSLPADWPGFTARMMEIALGDYEASQARLLKEHAAQLLPRGRAAKFLATLDRDNAVALISQKADDSWGLAPLAGGEEIDLADDETLEVGDLGAAVGFRWQKRHGHAATPASLRDSKAFMDTLLKGLKMPRVIGSQAIRITSLGPATHESIHVDRFDRAWQLREWSLGYADLHVVTLALPTPDGHAGLVQISNAAGLPLAIAGLRLMADYMHVSYFGSPEQWTAFLANRELCPPMLRGLRFSTAGDTEAALAGLDVRIPAKVLSPDSDSGLSVYLGYFVRGGKLVAQPAGITIEKDPGNPTTWVGVWAQPKPAADAGAELNKRWQQMSARGTGFDGKTGRDADLSAFWVISAIGDPQGDLQYEVTLNLFEGALLPREVNQKRDALHAGLVFRED